MMGILLLWMGSLVIAFVADSVLDTQLSIRAVERSEQRTNDELAARSITEAFARVLQFDPDRAHDSPHDAWASFVVPTGEAYDGLWSVDVEVTVRDCERAPPAGLMNLVSQDNRRSMTNRGFSSPARWLNVLTADVDAWMALGLSKRSSRRLVEQSRRGSVDASHLVSTPGLLSRETRILRRLLDEGVLKTRSEYFVLTCVMNGTSYHSLLHRDAARGDVRLICLRRMGE